MDERRSRRRVELARSGDAEAFTDLIRGCDPRMRALAYGMMGSAEATDDALQIAYLKAYRNVERFEERSSFDTWLYSIVYRTCIDELRKRRPTVPIDVLERTPDPSPDVGDRVGLASSIDDALHQIPAAQRAAVLLVDAQGLAHNEAAAVLDIPVGTLASRLSRARATLRQLLDPSYTTDSPRDRSEDQR